MTDDIKDRIRQKSLELFMKYGIRAVTMDEISVQLGISKKTIYHFFEDKDELVLAIIEFKIEGSKCECMSDVAKAKDPIHEMILAIEMMQEMFENMNPAIMGELEKFYPVAYKKFLAYKYNFIYDQVKDNLKRGIEAGLYREDLDLDVLIKFRLETMMMAFNQQMFPAGRYSLFKVALELTLNFLFGIATLKGHKLITKYEQDRNYKRENPGEKNLP